MRSPLVSLTPPTAGYLDAIFAAIRTFAHELAEGRAWLGRAREVRGGSWRFELLAAAQGSLVRAGASLWEVEERVRGLGKPEEIPAPLDQLAKNLPGMRAELEAEENALAALEREMMERPLGVS
jgi:hypothetical protein